MRKIIAIAVLILTTVLGTDIAFARGYRGYRSSGYRVRTPRVYYGGGRHTYSHQGQYWGGSGSSHRGGRYYNPASFNRYGRHR